MHIVNFQAHEFIDATGIDALAVCIGNVHGIYPASGPNLRLDLLKVKYFNFKSFFLCNNEITFVIILSIRNLAWFPIAKLSFLSLGHI